MIETNLFDQEELYENCTVQVLTNSVTGECSVGWWENSNPPEEVKRVKCAIVPRGDNNG